jgi:hypothetical protein
VCVCVGEMEKLGITSCQLMQLLTLSLPKSTVVDLSTYVLIASVDFSRSKIYFALLP